MSAQVSPGAAGRRTPNPAWGSWGAARGVQAKDTAWTDSQGSGGSSSKCRGLNIRQNDPSGVRNCHRASLSSLGPKVPFGEDTFSTDDPKQC